VHYRFGIAVCSIAVAGGFQSRTQIRVIEDFAVVDNPQRAVLIAHGLRAGRDVDDAQAAMT
jgi:hypothetical protein